MTASSRPWAVKQPCLPAEVSIYRRQFSKAHPNTGGGDSLQSLNTDSLKVVAAYLEPSMARAKLDQNFQFERFGYFVADPPYHLRVASRCLTR